MKYDPFVYGKHQGENITGLEHDGDIIREVSQEVTALSKKFPYFFTANSEKVS